MNLSGEKFHTQQKGI